VDTNQLVPALEERQIDGYIAEGSEENLGKTIRRNNDLYSKEDFKYGEEQDSYTCPAGKCLLPKQQSCHQSKYSQQDGIVYRTTRGVCLGCCEKSRCTTSDNPLGRSIIRTPYERMRERMRQKLKSEAGNWFTKSVKQL
jgi:hypothetical protein